MKRILLLILSLALALGISAIFTACGPSEAPTGCTEHIDENGDGICDNEGCNAAVEVPGDGESDEYFNEKGELILYRNSVPTFQFVIGLGPSGDTTIKDLTATLSSLGLAKVNIAKATEENKIQDVEIIFGTVNNRGDEYKFDIHTLGLEGYIVKQVGTKILVIAGSSGVYDKAIQHLKSEVFGLKANNKKFTNLVMSADKNKVAIQNNYSLKDVTLDGTSIRGYSIVHAQADRVARNIATSFQEKLYEKTGIWLPIIRDNKLTEGTPYIKIALLENDGEGGGFYFNIDEDKNATLESEFSFSFERLANDFFEEKIYGDDVRGTATLTSFNPDYRNITYEQFGAVGDGKTDDFFAIKAAHDAANADKMIVHADGGAVYYFGKGSGTSTIEIKTDTFWNGCKFIFDDHEIEPYSDEFKTPIFTLAPDNGIRQFGYTSVPFTSLREGDTSVGWAPGYRAMLVITNSNVKHFIRYGPNQDSGASQTELIVVDKDGNIDPMTPVQWTFDTITKLVVYNLEDTPITVDGRGKDGRRTLVETIFNGAPSKYTYYERNIMISRSNATIKYVEHIITGEIPESEGGTGAPYGGFTSVEYCESSNIDNFIFQMPENYNTIGSAGESVGMGTYELTATFANNILWSNCTQSNFFEADGSVKYHGMMGTNYCKNLTFDNMFVCSFDAHKGTYNATLKNSTCEHLNFIGEGTITLENMTVYTDGAYAGIILRKDYGSTWEGNLIIDGLDMRYSDQKKSKELYLIKAEWVDHDFGYQTHLPKYISLTDITLSRYSYNVVGGARTEQTLGVNEKRLAIVHTALLTNEDRIVVGNSSDCKLNPLMSVERVEIFNSPSLNFYIPDTPLFKNTKLFVDGVEKQKA